MDVMAKPVAFPRSVNARTGAMTSVPLTGVRRAVPLNATPVLNPRRRQAETALGPRVNQAQAAMDRALHCAMTESSRVIDGCIAIDRRRDLCAQEKIDLYVAADSQLKPFIAATPDSVIVGVAGRMFASANARLRQGYSALVNFQAMASPEDQADDVAFAIMAALELIDHATLSSEARLQAYEELAARLMEARAELFDRCPLAGIEGGPMLHMAQAKLRLALQSFE